MTEPRFKVGDKVYIPADRGVTDEYRGAKGTVIEVDPGTGPGAQFVGPNERLEWSSEPLYLIDFGPPIGRQRIHKALLEPDSN